MLSEGNCHTKTQSLKTPLLKNIPQNDFIIACFIDKKIFIVATRKTGCNYRTCAPKAVKEKDVVAKCLCA